MVSKIVYIAYNITISKIIGCYSSVDNAKKVIREKNMHTQKWCIMEYTMDQPFVNHNNIVCDNKTNPNKYFYNISSYPSIVGVYIVYNADKYIFLGCYSSFAEIEKNVNLNVKLIGNDNWHIYDYNLNDIHNLDFMMTE